MSLLNFPKTKLVCFIFAGTLAAMPLGGCTRTETRLAEPLITHCSTKGTPILTRQKAESVGVRFFGLGSSPSMTDAFNSLYEETQFAGCPIDGNKLAFQNIVTEEKKFFLYPILGWSQLTVSADLYSYENEKTTDSE